MSHVFSDFSVLSSIETTILCILFYRYTTAWLKKMTTSNKNQQIYFLRKGKW